MNSEGRPARTVIAPVETAAEPDGVALPALWGGHERPSRCMEFLQAGGLSPAGCEPVQIVQCNSNYIRNRLCKNLFIPSYLVAYTYLLRSSLCNYLFFGIRFTRQRTSPSPMRPEQD